MKRKITFILILSILSASGIQLKKSNLEANGGSASGIIGQTIISQKAGFGSHIRSTDSIELAGLESTPTSNTLNWVVPNAVNPITDDGNRTPMPSTGISYYDIYRTDLYGNKSHITRLGNEETQFIDAVDNDEIYYYQIIGFSENSTHSVMSNITDNKTWGCTDAKAVNHNDIANIEDGSCLYKMQLAGGNNLISFPGKPFTSNTDALMSHLENMGAEIQFILGQGVGLFNTEDEWSGNLNYVDLEAGFWLNIVDPIDWHLPYKGFSCIEDNVNYDYLYSECVDETDRLISGVSKEECEAQSNNWVDGCINNCLYSERCRPNTIPDPCHNYIIPLTGNNLLSYLRDTSMTTLQGLGENLPIEQFTNSSYQNILGQGLGLFSTDEGWSGNLTNLESKKGYWIFIEDEFPIADSSNERVFRWGMGTECEPYTGEDVSTIASISSNPLLEIPTEFRYKQSTEQSIFAINDIKINGRKPSKDDLILAYNDNVLVGSAKFTEDEKTTFVPVMGRDITKDTYGYCFAGDKVNFKIYDSSADEIVNLNGDVPGWQSLNLVTVNNLSGEMDIPSEFMLGNPYPNPFNPVTHLKYDLLEESIVQIIIYDIVGRKVDEVLNKSQIAGRYSLSYEPENLSSGIYFLNMNTKSLEGKESFSKTQKITLLK